MQSLISIKCPKWLISYSFVLLNFQCILKWLSPKAPSQVFCVNYRAFLDQICSTVKCALGELFTPPCERDTEPDPCCIVQNACPDTVHPCVDFSFLNPNFCDPTQQYKDCQPWNNCTIPNNCVYKNTNKCPNPAVGLLKQNRCCEEIEAGDVDYYPGNVIGYDDLLQRTRS